MRLCLFCSDRANSIEDAWPKWITNQFKGSRPSAVSAERAGVRLPSWTVHQPTLQIRCVCSRCNNEWMSRLEGQAQPFLQSLLMGNPCVLDRPAQTAVATWAVKTAMVLEGLDPGDKHVYSQLQRERFRLRAEMPSRTSVWLAASATPDWFMSAKNRHLGAVPAGFAGISTTMGFAHLVLQVLTIRVPEDVGPTTKVTTDVRKGQWSDATVQVWPTREDLRWPPRLGLNGESGLSLLAERFATFDAPLGETEQLSV
jgi:hypothetical protein